MIQLRSLVRAVAAAALAVACTSPSPRTTEGSPDERATTTPSRPGEPAEASADERADPLAPKPWTTAFEPRSVLLANQVRIEGPEGLFDHLYVDASNEHAQSARTIAEGYEQVVEARPGSGEMIRAQLDGLRIQAVQRIVVLERVTPCDVRVVASGEVWWSDVNGSEERGDTWERSGAIER